MIVTTTESIPGNEIVEILGLSRGSTVRARNVGRDIFAALKNLIGGEINEYTKLTWKFVALLLFQTSLVISKYKYVARIDQRSSDIYQMHFYHI